MYNMRYHLASLVSVFFALAIGLVLGGLISERAPDNIHEVLLEGIERDIAQVREDNTRLRNENSIAYHFADLLLGNFVQGKLEERTILVLGQGDTETLMVLDILEDAGAIAVHVVPEFDDEYREWKLQSDQDLEEKDFTGAVSVFEPTGEEGEYLSGYFAYLREMQEYYDFPVVFMTTAGMNEADDIDDEEEISDLVASAWEEGFSGTNQLGNRYGAYTLIVLLASNTEGKYGRGEHALDLYPSIPSEWLLFVDLDGEEETNPQGGAEIEENTQ